MKIVTHSKEETQAIAKQLGSLLKQGDTFLLLGDLGAGKTTFVQGLAKGLEINDRVNSPTFVIMKQYEGRLPLVHIDAYRLEGIDQDLGFEDYDDASVVRVIEWPQYYIDDLNEYSTIEFIRLDEDTREIKFNLKNKELEAELKECL